METNQTPSVILSPITDHSRFSLDMPDADEEIINSLRLREESLRAIYLADELVGVLDFSVGHNGYLYVYITPRKRGLGVGSHAVAMCEREAMAEGVRLLTTYRTDAPAMKEFAVKRGYAPQYTSRFMTYRGGPFVLESQAMRGYLDEDYDAAHALYALAFHEMRKQSGFFASSVPEPPSDWQRAQWANTVNERALYTLDGEIVAYAHVMGDKISSVAVACERQGHGIGRQFVKLLCNHILAKGHSAVKLYCVTKNERAYGLCRSLGFQEMYVSEYAAKDLSQRTEE